MARQFLTPINLNRNELQNAVVQNLSTAPGTPTRGQIYYDTVSEILYFWNGTAWISTSGSAEVIQDTVASMIVAGTGLDSTYNDNAGTLTLNIDSTVVTLDGNQTLTNKSINLANNTLTGTVAQFNSALSDDNFVTLTGTETLSNKTLTSPKLSGTTFSDGSIVFEGVTTDDFETLLQVEDPTADNILTIPNKTGTLATTGDITSAINSISTSDIEEGTNLYYTDERVDDRVAELVTDGTGIITTYNDTAGTLEIKVDTDVIATKSYVDAVAEGLHVHESVAAATTENITLATPPVSLDGVNLTEGMRVLVKDQAAKAENGIYVLSSGALVRAADFNSALEIASGDFVFVSGGTTYGSTGWVQKNQVSTVGTDPIEWIQFSGAGTYSAGNGLTLDGTTFNVGAGTGIVANANDVAIDTTVVARKYTEVIGDGVTNLFTVTHGLNNRWVTVQVYENSSPYSLVETDVELFSATQTKIGFTVAPGTDQYRVVIVG